MANVEEKILDIQVRYDDAIRGIAKYQSAVDAARQHEKDLKKQLEENEISREQYNAEMAATRVVIQENNEAIRVLNKEIQNNRKVEKENEGSLKSLRAELSNLTAQYDALGRAERNAAKGKELQDKINAITDELKGAEEETQRFYRNVGNYEESIKNAIGLNNDFANSIMELAQNSQNGQEFFANMKNEVLAFGNTLKGLLTNKVFLSLAGIAGTGFAVKWWYDYNKGVQEATRLTRQFTNLSGNELKEYRTEVQALADFYGKDFREVLVSVNALSKQFGIEEQEALNIIRDGFIAGADASGEFLDILREYPAYFKEAGITADQLVAIVAESTRQGIFSDKGIDTIKEANIRLREMTTTTADALEGIGISSQEVQKALQDGTATTFDIIRRVSERLNELPDSASSVGTAIADIFGSQGEDAGLKYIRTLKDIGTNLDEVKSKAGELGRVEEDLINSQTELSKEVALLFDATGGAFERFTSKVRLFVNDVLTSLVKTVRQLTESVEERGEREQSQYEQAGRENAAEQVQKEYDKINAARKKYVEQGMTDEEALTKAREERLDVMRLTLEQEEAYLQESKEANIKYNKELEDASFWRQGVGLDRTNAAIKRDIQSSWNDYMNQTSAVASQRELVRLVSEYDGGTNGRTAIVQETEKETAAMIDAKKKELEAIRNAEDAMLVYIKDSREKQRKEIELQYDREVEDLKARLDTETYLTTKAKEAINNQIKALEEQKKIELQRLSDEELQKEIENRQKLIELQLESVEKGSEKEYQLKMDLLQSQRDAELKNTELTEEMKLAITNKYNKQIDDLSAQRDADLLQKQQEAIRLRYETEIAMANGNEQEILRIRLEQKENELNSIHQLEGESIEEFNLRKIELENDYLNEKQKLADKEVEIESKKAMALSSLAGNLSALLEQAAGDNKEMAQLAKMLAIAEVAIAQGVAIAQAVKTATSSSATWIDMLAAIGTVVAAVTSVMATATKSINSAKFATGGLVTGPGTETSDSIPARLSNGESVMTAAATSMFAPMLSAFNQMGGGIPINVTASSNQALGEDMLARAVAKGMMMAPPPIVSIEEFNSVANRVKYVENLGDV